jgi:hypothetical protein
VALVILRNMARKSAAQQLGWNCLVLPTAHVARKDKPFCFPSSIHPCHGKASAKALRLERWGVCAAAASAGAPKSCTFRRCRSCKCQGTAVHNSYQHRGHPMRAWALQTCEFLQVVTKAQQFLRGAGAPQLQGVLGQSKTQHSHMQNRHLNHS